MYGWLILALVAVLTLRWLAAEAAVVIWGPKVAERDAQAQECRRLADDADYEHWHALWGDQDVATYGRFQP